MVLCTTARLVQIRYAMAQFAIAMHPSLFQLESQTLNLKPTPFIASRLRLRLRAPLLTFTSHRLTYEPLAAAFYLLSSLTLTLWLLFWLLSNTQLLLYFLYSIISFASTNHLFHYQQFAHLCLSMFFFIII